MVSITDIFDDATPPPPPAVEDAAQQFLNEFTYWLSQDYAQHQAIRLPGLHASSLWKTCARKRVLLAASPHISEAEVSAAGNYLTMDIGAALHHWWQNNYLGPMGRLIGDWYCARCDAVTATGSQPATCPQCKGDRRVVYTYAETLIADKELDYVGHTDGVVELHDRRFVFEFKSISQTQYETLNKPKIEHVVQTHAYMNALKLQDSLVVYQNKGKQCSWSRSKDGKFIAGPPELRVFHVRFDQDYWTTYVNRIKDYHKAGEFLRRLPIAATPADATKFTRLCSHERALLAESCPVVTQCFGLPL